MELIINGSGARRIERLMKEHMSYIYVQYINSVLHSQTTSYFRRLYIIKYTGQTSFAER